MLKPIKVVRSIETDLDGKPYEQIVEHWDENYTLAEWKQLVDIDRIEDTYGTGFGINRFQYIGDNYCIILNPFSVGVDLLRKRIKNVI